MKKRKSAFKLFLSFSLGLLICCLFLPSTFAQSQRFIKNLYSSYLKSLKLASDGEYDKALKELKHVKAKDPQSIHVRLKIATLLINLERIEEAESVLKEAQEISPDNFDISLALIFVYSYTKKNEELEKEYENFLKRAHEHKPKNVGISEYLAQFYFYKKRPQEAIKIYEKILENSPDYVEALFWLGYLYEEEGRRSQAIKTWKKGLETAPDHAPTLNSLGYIYAEDSTNLNEAEGMIKKALEKEPQNGAYLDSLGWVYFKKGNFKKAKSYLIKAIEYIKDPDVYEHLGDLYIKLDDIDKGVAYYRQGISQFPDDKDLKLKIKKYGKENKTLKE